MSDHLTDGWEPDLDHRDTVLRGHVYNLAARYRFSAERTGGAFLDDGSLAGVQMSEGTPWGNDVVLLQPLREGRVAGFVERLSGFAANPTHVWSAWPTPDLSGHGLDLMGHPPAMVRPPGGEAPPVPDGLRVVEAEDAETLAEYDRTGIEGFPVNRPDGSRVEAFLDARLLGGPWRFFLGYAGDVPAAVASVFVGCGVGQVEFVATLPEFRRRGYGEAVTWAATLAEPSLPAVLLASDDGRPVYERMGYLATQRFTLWYWPGTT